MSRRFVFCSLIVLLSVVVHYSTAQSIRSTCTSINVCHPMIGVKHTRENYLLGKMLSDKDGKDNSGQNFAQQGSSSGQVKVNNADNAVEAAIKSAQEKVSSAEQVMNNALTSAKTAATASTEAETKELQEIEAAKTEAAKLESGITDVQQFVKTITEAEQKGKEKIKEAKEKATSAVTKANDANTKIENAKKELKEAEGITEENQKDQKKQKASEAGTKADNAANDAKSVETDISQSTAALSEVQKAHKNAQLALYKIKAVVEASKVDKAYESIKNNEKSMEKVKAEADAIIQTMKDFVNTLFDPLKQKGKKQYDASKGPHKIVQKEMETVKNSELRVKWKKTQAHEGIESVKAKTTLDEAKKEYEKVEEAISSATSEENNTINALNKANVELKKLQKTKLSFDAIQNADNVYLAVVLSKEFEEKAKKEEQSAISNISEMETISTDDMTEESKKKITDQLGNAKNILKTFGSDVEAIIKTKEDAESHKMDANKIAEKAANAADNVAAERAMNKSHEISLLALSEVVNAQNHFKKVVEKAQDIEKLKYAAKTIALTHGITQIISVTRGYVKEAKEKEIAADLSVKAIEVLLTHQVTDVKQKVTQQLNNANQALHRLKSEISKLNAASTIPESQLEAANTAVTTTQEAVSAADAKREAQKVITAASTAEKELKKAKVALDGVKIDAAKIERATHTANVVIDANKMDQLYNAIKQDYDGVIEKKRALDAIVTAVQQIFNECPKEARDEMKSYLHTSQAAQAATQIELNDAQQAEEKTKQLKEEALTALTNVMKAETPLTEIQTMTAKVSDSIKVAQEKAQSAHNAMIKAKTEFDKAEKVQYVASVLLSSLKAGQAVRNANIYKKSVTEKKEEAKSAIKIIEGLHQRVSIGSSFIIMNHLSIVEELFETLSEQEIYAVNAANKAKTAKEEVDRFLAEVNNPNISVNDVKSIAEKAKASEIHAAREEGKAKSALTSVTSDLTKITEAKQDAENVNSKSQKGSSKPVKKRQGTNTKHIEIQTPEFGVNNNNTTTKKNTETYREKDVVNNSTKPMGSKSSSNTENTDETENNVNKTVDKKSDSAVNPFHTIFVLLIILFLGSHDF